MKETEAAQLSREFRLAAACCVQPPARAADRIGSLGAGGVDWALFCAIAGRHRVNGLVNQALKVAAISPPPHIAAAFALAATYAARQNLAFANEAVRLHRLFGQSGVSHLFVKGATLSILAYGSLGPKHARDIDLLIAPHDVERSCAVLSVAGYRVVRPAEALGKAGLKAWTAVSKESTWQNKAGILVELHHALMDNPLLLDGVTITGPRQNVDIGGGERLPTLARDELFAYLCVHGASHAWSRLKWLADVAAILQNEEEAELVRLHDRAVALGAGRCAGSALLLCNLLFHTQLSSEFETRLRCDGATLCLVRTAVDMMTRGGGVREVDRMMFGTVPLHLSLFLLKPGLRYQLAELRQKLKRPDDHAVLHLPRWLHFLYPLLLFPRWLRYRFALRSDRGSWP